MKRLALLLAAMGIVTVGVAAAELKVTNVGQELEIENTSGGSNIGEATYLTTSVGLSYGDWTFGIAGTKFWNADTDSIDSYDGRLQLDAWKKITPDLSLGLRYRGYSDHDRYYVRWNYSKDWFWSSGDVWYTSYNGNEAKPDSINLEVYPLGFKYGVFKAGWFVNYVDYVGSDVEGTKENYLENQIRAYMNLYKDEKLSIDTEVRVTLNSDADYTGGKKAAKADDTLYKDFGRNRVYLGASYNVSEALNVYAKYGYEFRDLELVQTGKDTDSNSYFGDFIVGWNYKF
ncbi:MAG: hypothetical protein MR995_11165 [Fusobacterium mortiferum]|jgi:outer membrane protein G|uniref:hypothetical protein n=1 Tax=Fusobacterium mortiferum TaxID=850 RepID=UPI000E47CDD9|nr:hypothetical protein [Fusobacterium mortiferum]MCI7188683.1 hypothetical protein [Fusobacterium mortiferum]MCI7665442.1 hypothetical protein [Fusobacterium mortiferum]MDY2800429.1 hypothetical protein [Fusobacterium mortiferum]RHF66316.1 hypothetical protein DW670_06085 [Fusobacterium mortiferum]